LFALLGVRTVDDILVPESRERITPDFLELAIRPRIDPQPVAQWCSASSLLLLFTKLLQDQVELFFHFVQAMLDVTLGRAPDCGAVLRIPVEVGFQLRIFRFMALQRG
jgi:hypothetical protein